MADANAVDYPLKRTVDLVGAVIALVLFGVSTSDSFLSTFNVSNVLVQVTPLMLIALGQAFVERTPNGRLALFDCGHAIHIEQREAFRATLSEFLQSVERGTA